jgi:hypothetical protein
MPTNIKTTSAQSSASIGVLFLFKPAITHFAYLKKPHIHLSISLSLSSTFELNMSGLSFRSLAFMLFMAFLVWSSNFEACNARRGRHWRHSRATSASLAKKKGKNHGKGNYHHSGGSKPKSPPSKAPSPPNPKPKEDLPSSPPQKGSNGGHSVTFNVLDFGAKGDGSTVDTQFILQILIFENTKKKKKKNLSDICCWETYGLRARILIFSDKYKHFSFLTENSGECQYSGVVGSIHRSSLF